MAIRDHNGLPLLHGAVDPRSRPLVAYFQTRWYRTGDERYLRMTKFWGKIFLINFIMGVATGIVQEFQFGMAWSEYSPFVGDVFGAPLAMEALIPSAPRKPTR